MRFESKIGAEREQPEYRRLVRTIIESFPLVSIIDVEHGQVGHAHVDFQDRDPIGSLEFRLTSAPRPASKEVIVIVSGPAADIGAIDQPTSKWSAYNYLRLALRCRLDERGHAANDPADADPGGGRNQAGHRVRLQIENYELDVVLEVDPKERFRIVAGLRSRGRIIDEPLANLLEGFDGSIESLIRQLRSLRGLRRPRADSASLCWARGH